MAISKNETTKKVKLNLKGLSPDEKQLAKSVAGEILVEEINDYLDTSRSPVKGGKYKRRKKDGLPSLLLESGDMRSFIDFEPLESDHVEVGVFEDSPTVERLKMFNHNVGDTLPRRETIPAPNKVFKKDIMAKVNRAVDEIRARSRDEGDELLRLVLEDVGELDI